MKKILIYLTGRPSDDVSAWASEMRKTPAYVHYRSEPSSKIPFKLIPCDGFVSDHDEVIQAYEAAGVERLVIGDKAKTKKEPAPVAEPEVEAPESVSETETPAELEAITEPDVEATEITLDSSNEDLVVHLNQRSPEERDAWFAEQGGEALANYLVTRADRERKNWKTQQMGNMIEKHLGLDT